MHSTGGPMMGYGVKPSGSGQTFASATGITIDRGAYTIEGAAHDWYTGGSQAVAIDGQITMTNRMRLNATGLGIATTSPNALLDVRGPVLFGAGTAVNNMGATNYISVSTTTIGQATGIEFFTNDATYNPRAWIVHTNSAGAQTLTFNSTFGSGTGYAKFAFLNGNVGIGTSNPGTQLHVQGEVSASSYTSSISNGVGYFGTASRAVTTEKVDVLTGGSTTGLGIYSGSFSGSFFGNTGGGTVGPGTINTLALFSSSTSISSSVVIQSSNNIGIGASPSYKLDVSGDTRVNNGALGVNVTPNAQDGRIDAGNDIVSFSSDRRLKIHVTQLSNSLEKVKSLTGFTYNWNTLAHTMAGFDTGSRYIGVYAQDVQAILPEAVKLAPFDNDGTDTSISGENYLTVQYEKMVPLLIEAIKELSHEVDRLKQMVKNPEENKN
jgi:hypothetical protein